MPSIHGSEGDSRMGESLLKVENLKTWFDTADGQVHAVDGIDLTVGSGETVALLGESGCGKSMTALSLLRLVPAPAGRIVGGKVWLGDTDLLRLPELHMRQVRGRRLAMIFQEPQSSLNPVLTIGEQIREALPDLAALSKLAARHRVTELLQAVGMADPERRYDAYPHELSGGMKQRAMIAIALAAKPDILLADEPTTALDVTLQSQILDLLKDLQQRTGMGLVLITHDLGVVSQMADRVAVMYAGQIVEQASRERFFAEPRHPYSQKLFRSLPSRLKRGASLEVIEGSVPSLAREFLGCRFAERCDFAADICRDRVPAWISDAYPGGVRCHLYDSRSGLSLTTRPVTVAPVPESEPGDVRLRVEDMKVHFPIRKGVLQRPVAYVRAVDGVSFEIRRGQTLALVGESGCGKTTVGKGVLQLLRPSAGRVHFGEEELTSLSGRKLRDLRRRFQIIFQDPYSSLDPRMRVWEILEEGMRAQELGGDSAARRERVAALLDQVGLPAEAAQRYPHEFSGGQRQRICIARALAVEPELIVCDEPTSALDVSVQAQVLNLFKRLQADLELSYLFITHNLSVVEYLAHEIAVMYLGRIVEHGRVDDVLDRPAHPYTQALLSAVPLLEGDKSREVIRLTGDVPSPASPPPGCHFHPRCPRVMDVCRERYPDVTELSATHRVHCHLYPAA
jgi:oligopeptide/dipeptide ABC transporter ATP-binding protein